ncbi:MAG TPA: hypothetical protein VJL34_11265 [Anaerolineales bacterium]|nr:hypothetical protein [Anaerolineales bacterium]
MTQTARLITPEGKSIELPADIYLQVKNLLDARQQRKPARSRARMKAAIQAGFGLTAGGDSLTAALLEEHAKERARDDTRLDWLKN